MHHIMVTRSPDQTWAAERTLVLGMIADLLAAGNAQADTIDSILQRLDYMEDRP